MGEVEKIVVIFILKAAEFFVSWYFISEKISLSLFELGIFGISKIIIGIVVLVLVGKDWAILVLIVLAIENIFVYLILFKKIIWDKSLLMTSLSSFILSSAPLVTKKIKKNIDIDPNKSGIVIEEDNLPNYPFTIDQDQFMDSKIDLDYDYFSKNLDFDNLTGGGVLNNDHFNIYCNLLCTGKTIHFKDVEKNSQYDTNEKILQNALKPLLTDKNKYKMTVFSLDALLENNPFLLDVLEKNKNFFDSDMSDSCKRYYILKGIETCPNLMHKLNFKKLVSLHDVKKSAINIMNRQNNPQKPKDLLLTLKNRDIDSQTSLNFVRFVDKSSKQNGDDLWNDFIKIYQNINEKNKDIMIKALNNPDSEVDQINDFSNFLQHNWSVYKTANDLECKEDTSSVEQYKDCHKPQYYPLFDKKLFVPWVLTYIYGNLPLDDNLKPTKENINNLIRSLLSKKNIKFTKLTKDTDISNANVIIQISPNCQFYIKEKTEFGQWNGQSIWTWKSLTDVNKFFVLRDKGWFW